MSVLGITVSRLTFSIELIVDNSMSFLFLLHVHINLLCCVISNCIGQVVNSLVNLSGDTRIVQLMK